MKSNGKMPNWKTVMGWAFLGAGILMLGRCFFLCFSQDIWYDELFTVGFLPHSYGEIASLTAKDVHPPLYYWIVKFFSSLIIALCKLIGAENTLVAAAKLCSVIPYFLLLIYCLTFLRKRFGMFVGGMFFFCVLTMPQMSAYTVEVRMYSWALFFVTAALLHAYETCTADSRNAQRLHGAAFVLYGLAAAYTQYFACVAVVMVYLYVLVAFFRRDRGRIKEWIFYVLLSVAGYVPWLISLLGQIAAVKNNYWILPLSLRSVGGCVKFLCKPAFTNETVNLILAVLLFILYVCFFGMAVLRERQERKPQRELAMAGLGILLGLVAFGFAASFLIRPVFVYRYMLPAMGGFWLCFVLCLDMEGKKEKRKWSTVLSLLVALGIAVIGLRDYRAFMGEEEYKILLMKDTREALAKLQEGDIVLYNFDQVQLVTSYYVDGLESCLWGGETEELIREILNSSCTFETFGDVEDTQKFQQVKEWLKADRRVWFIGSFQSREEIVQELQDDGFQVEEQGSYLLERYWFNLYSIKNQDV